MTIKLLNNFLLLLGRKILIAGKVKALYSLFCKSTRQELREILPEVPNIGDSIFKSSYYMGVCFIAWYKAFTKLGMSGTEANQWIWQVLEHGLKKIPPFLVPLAKKIYIGGMLKKAVSHTEKSRAGTLPECDWSIEYSPIDSNSFRLDVYECGIQKLCRKFHAEELLPSLCRTDYLVAHYLHAGFERTQTLGDGNSVCNNTFHLRGDCQWMPEKGFVDRK